MTNPVETIEHAIESLAGVLPPLRSPWRKVLVLFGWLLLALYFIFAAIFLSLRYWVLPHISDYAQDIAATISAGVGGRVTIGRIDAGWQGLRPYLELADMRVHDRQGMPALVLPAVNATVSWLSLPRASLRFHSFEFIEPSLAIGRDVAGQFFIAGLELERRSGDSGFADWLLSQREIVIRNGRISWVDEQRKAPRLELAGVNFRLANDGSSHRFALQADPPAALASALDVRGDFTGVKVSQLQRWSGQVYAKLEYIDLAQWQCWIDYPIEVQRGKGGLRMWLSIDQGKPIEVVADVAMAGLAARFAPELALLELDTLQGRVGARSGKEDFHLFGKGIAVQAPGRPALAPTDLALTLHAALTGKPRGGNLNASALEFDRLAWLLDFFPVSAAIRQVLAETAPAGNVQDVKLDWVGVLPLPEQFNVRGRFSRLAMRSYAGVPGFSGLSGSIDGNERSGSVSLKSEKVALDMTGVLNDPRLEVDTLTGQFGWNRQREGQLEVRVANLSVANKDAAGSAFGSWLAGAPGEGPGTVDITARLTRFDGGAATRYLPALVGPAAVNWLKRALVSARSSDVRFRVKGALREFPWDNGKKGQFQIVAKIRDGTLDYVEGWPPLTRVDADLSLEGKRLLLTSAHAAVLGARLSGVRVLIPDLLHGDHRLSIGGYADGPTAEFFKFIEASPVGDMIGHFTEQAKVQGDGRLQLQLELPLQRPADLKVAGHYLFSNNQLLLSLDLPPLTGVNGRLDFTHTGVSAQGISAKLLGGPLSVSATTRGGGLSVNAQGTLNAAELKGFYDSPFTRSMQGTAPYRAMISVRKRVADVVFTSDLGGLALDLPAPLGKAASDLLALRIERVHLNEQEAARRGVRARAEVTGGVRSETRAESQGDIISASLGTVVSLQLLRRREGAGYRIVRGGIGFNETAVLPERFGVQVSGTLRSVDVDRWRELMSAAAVVANTAAAGGAPGTPAGEDGGLPINAVNLRISMLDVGAKRFNEVSLRAARSNEQWQASVAARELSGEIIWRSAGRGALLARLKHLAIPDNRPGVGTNPSQAITALPGIDLIVDNFVSRDKKFGRLELQAAHATDEWRIEKMLLSSKEGTLFADGVWKSTGEPVTSLNVKLDVSDVGKYLERMGSPGTLTGGTAKIEGKLAWAGTPQGFDYPSLAGKLTLQVDKGQFLKVDPGIAKLIGLFSLQALPKRISLDFTDVFSDGFAFDTIKSTVIIERGIAATQDFAMLGSAAAVTIKGDADLARETQNLQVRVVPALGDSVATVAGLFLANPLTGIGALIAQRLFNNPLGQIFAYDYAVSGSWTDPKVEKISRPAAQAQDSAQGGGR